MDKRELLGVHKRKRSVKKNKKKVLKKVVDYLKSDSYMFAPLISPPLTNFLASRIVPSSSTTEVETTGNKKQRKKSFIQKVGEYLKSDTHLYSHLCVPRHPTSPKDFNGYVRRVTMEISTRKLIRENDQSTIEASNITVNDEITKGNIPGRNISSQQKFIHKEKVHVQMCETCRSSSVSGKPMVNSQLKKFLID
ncbi:hypothetical protein JCGZ_04116 [Jatropha curcas]|uniref:Uncharacterized protein n=2 Tax=Jatropha curcas TaxID=180498 RepID=A0A067KUZ1_JATCU|nr:hypothetical protein JCGZ_04116 [Jatropha curcas]